MQKINICLIFRLLIGGMFVVSGSEKLIGPYQNFLYVIQNYNLLDPALELLTAKLFPWIELFVGLFLLLGFWLKQALKGGLFLVFTFLIVVGQALIRNLPVTECGCFGPLMSLPLMTVLLMDCCILIILICLFIQYNRTSRLSLDNYFIKGL